MTNGRRLREGREGAADAEAAGHRRRREVNPEVTATLAAPEDAPAQYHPGKKMDQSI